MLTTYNGFKLGDRVFLPPGFWVPSDYGTIVMHNGEVFYEDTKYSCPIQVWVQWDSNKTISTIGVEYLSKVMNQISLIEEEQKAVALLLSLGYTLSKNTK